MIHSERPRCYYGFYFQVSVQVYGLTNAAQEHLRSDAFPDTTVICHLPYPLNHGHWIGLLSSDILCILCIFLLQPFIILLASFVIEHINIGFMLLYYTKSKSVNVEHSPVNFQPFIFEYLGAQHWYLASCADNFLKGNPNHTMTQIHLTCKFFFIGISELRDIIEKMMDEKNRG